MNKGSGRAEADADRSGPAGGPLPSARARRIDSKDLLGGAREIVIDHEGEHYRLRFTSKGKLILTK